MSDRPNPPVPEPKPIEKIKPEKESKLEHKEVKIEKIEIKEHKDLKQEKLEKNEAKEHKDAKQEKLEKNEAKEHKDAKNEKLEKNEFKEHKDAKHEKVEKIESKEIAKIEVGEKPQGKEKDGKEIFEGPGNPGDPVEQRLAALEQSVAGMQHFITSAQRPDLSQGALSGETDTPPRSRRS
jgi:colicin import membrane protein